MRAAENSIKDLKPEKQISFLFLTNKEDPDSFVNKNGKEYFVEFSKKNKILIHQFIFSHYKKQTETFAVYGCKFIYVNLPYNLIKSKQTVANSFDNSQQFKSRQPQLYFVNVLI